MRTYPSNSPDAAARIIALTLIADRDLSPPEFESLDRLAVHRQLGLSSQALHNVLDDLCVDLQASRQLRWEHDCPVDDCTLQTLMGELTDPGLRRRVLDLCIQLAEADRRVARGESLVLAAAAEQWGLHDHRLPLPSP